MVECGEKQCKEMLNFLVTRVKMLSDSWIFLKDASSAEDIFTI